MSNWEKTSPLPVTHHGRNGVQVPLDQAIANPKTVINTTPKTPLPAPTRYKQ